MSTSELKLSIFELLSSTKNSKVLGAIYEILSSDSKGKRFTLSTIQQKEIDRRIKNHESGKSKSYSWEEVKRKVRSGK